MRDLFVRYNKINKKKTKTDFRLPTIQELLTLVDYSKVDPSSNLGDTFSSHCWSSTTCANNTSYAWYVHFHGGHSYNGYKAGNCYVRCVRVSKKGKLQWSKISREKMTWHEAKKYAKNLKSKVYYREEK